MVDDGLLAIAIQRLHEQQDQEETMENFLIVLADMATTRMPLPGLEQTATDLSTLSTHGNKAYKYILETKPTNQSYTLWWHITRMHNIVLRKKFFMTLTGDDADKVARLAKVHDKDPDQITEAAPV